MKLTEEVKRLLVERDYTNRRCAEEFGVGQTWLSAFLAGRIQSPSADTLQRIYEALTGGPLINEQGDNK